MAKKCESCGAPLDGFFARISSLAGVKPSEKNPNYCNKCVSKIPKEAPVAEEAPVQPKDLYEAADTPKEAQPEAAPVEEVKEEAPATPESTEPVKEEPIVEEAIPSQEEAVDPFDAIDKKA